mmetsp:Transcript_84259/g.192162  ORF Transcript_84259/g.192162 Transcript_84259/m.192162 type:complete len:294 (-) Transcript_84259:836-1717(-)
MYMPYGDSSAPAFFFLETLCSSCITPTATTTSPVWAYSHTEYRVPCSTRPMIMEGKITQLFAMVCTGKDTYFNISYDAQVDSSLVTAKEENWCQGTPKLTRPWRTFISTAAATALLPRVTNIKMVMLALSRVTRASLTTPYATRTTLRARVVATTFMVVVKMFTAGRVATAFWETTKDTSTTSTPIRPTTTDATSDTWQHPTTTAATTRVKARNTPATLRTADLNSAAATSACLLVASSSSSSSCPPSHPSTSPEKSTCGDQINFPFFGTGNATSGTGTPKNPHNGSHPSAVS